MGEADERADALIKTEEVAHGAAGDRQPDRAAISWREQAGKTRILEIDRVSVRSDAPAIVDFR